MGSPNPQRMVEKSNAEDSTQMQAAFMEDIDVLRVRETDIPRISQDDILVRVDSCGVCGSDLRILSNGYKRVPLPQIMGHEIAATVKKVGKNQESQFKEGDRVALSADIPCGVCYWCKIGLSNHCIDNLGFGHEIPGGFAEYMAISKRIIEHGPIAKIAETKKSQDEFALCEPLACCINGFEICEMSAGKNLLIFGAGPIGCMLARLGRSLGAPQVVLCDIDETRLKLSKVAGADKYVLFEQEALQQTKDELTGGLGFEVVITACASAKAQEASLQYVKTGGHLNFFGGLPEGSKPILLDSNDIHYREIKVSGAHGSTPRTHRIAVEMVSKGDIDMNDLITGTYPLEQIEKAFEHARDKRALKIMIHP